MKVLRPVAWAVLLPVSVWSSAALAYDLHPYGSLAACGFDVLVAAHVVRSRRDPWALSLWLVLNLLVIAWWLALRPPPNQSWAPEFARAGWAERVGDHVTLHDVRNFSYRTETDFEARWETRTIDLNRVVGADLFLTHWGIPLVAHSIVSFRFADGTYLATSIEARRTKTQAYSAVRGFFRQFQVSFLLADERDVVRLRTNYRRGEEVYLYRTRLQPADARALLEDYLDAMNAVHDQPEWYNALTRNCATPMIGFLARAHIGGISRWDWRGILGGSGDRMLYDLHDLADGGLPFEALRNQAHINDAARAADQAPDFSARIRAGRAGFLLPEAAP